ncbi:MAG TPA: glycerol-3-phosphate 1-O-acyltransferase PlsY [Fimbriimonadaceae bacterium]|nr:glycerol-3-phosphate 1-O-acyltransferase PlsY [Fimbriimonadaceae bacterium]HRJ33231.1 glycerol-3-phosphate 1-O-acyltransferase PlsY [Fimbriimonadaceae bacterium]
MGIQEILLGIAAYGIGSLPFGVWVAKAKGVSILERGSGNPGATNVYRECGAAAGLTVFLLDVLKGLGPALAGRFLLDHELAPLILGLLAVAGHSLSPFLKFKGGKGVSTGLGVLIGSTPWVALAAFLVFLVSMLVWRFVSVSSLLAALAVFVFGYVFGDPVGAVVGYGLLFVFVLVRHRSNLQRLRNGTERKFSFRRSSSTDQPENQDPENGPPQHTS